MPQKRNNLVALSSAAVLAVYAAGYVRTRGTTEAFAREPAEIRPALPPHVTPVSAQVVGTTAVARPTSEPAPMKTEKKQKTSPKKDSVKTSEPMIAMAIVDTTKHDSLPEAPAAPAPVAAKTDTATQKADTTKQVARYKDGTWHGYGTSRHGDIEAEVVIKDGRITAARVYGCYTRYSCSRLDPLRPQG